ncbi:hypothetical protein E4U19_007351 [Claviceps sp. Clav32 group G5]|nr:hypothetical protein E4U19_007351 [Claviceps sp. Clav32 group G5]
MTRWEARGRQDFFGPFVDEDDFNLQCVALPNVVHRSGHEIVFTHGDLNMRNIMMHNERLSGDPLTANWETFFTAYSYGTPVKDTAFLIASQKKDGDVNHGERRKEETKPQNIVPEPDVRQTKFMSSIMIIIPIIESRMISDDDRSTSTSFGRGCILEPLFYGRNFQLI